jgi:hypothetical protein
MPHPGEITRPPQSFRSTNAEEVAKKLPLKVQPQEGPASDAARDAKKAQPQD